METGQRIQSLRIEKGITQARLVALSGISQARISDIEKGKRDMTVSTLIRLCAAMDIHPGQLFEFQAPSSQRHWITRNRIEKIARAFWGSPETLSIKERELVSMLKKVIPTGRKARSQKSVYAAWSRIRSQYTKDEIGIFAQRVRSEANRRHA